MGGKAERREREAQPGPDTPHLPKPPLERPHLPKGGGSGMPIQGGGKGKPGAGLASGEEAGPGAEAEAAVAAVVVAAPLGRERAAEEQEQEVSKCRRASASLASIPWLMWFQRAHLHWWTEGPQPLLSRGEVGQAGRGPWGATAGTCLEGREAGGPGGLQREDRW